MGRIIGYQYDNDIKDNDAWIGTEATSRRTKQYTAQAVADYLNINGSISIVGQMSYKYSTAPLNGIGTFAVFGGGPNIVAFSAITKLTLNNQDISEQRVVEYLNLLVGSDMLISESEQISTFGYYSIDSYAVNATNSDYYDLSVTFKSGNGFMEGGKVYDAQNFTLAGEENISTLQTTIDAGNTYQASPSDALWTWSSNELTITSTSFTSLLSGKRFKTTFIGSGSYTDVLPNSINFYNSLDSLTTLTSSSTAVAAAITLELPSSSGTLALTTDIIDSPWDTVLGGINYAGGDVGIGTTGPLAKLHVFGGSAIIGDDDFNAVKISANGSGTTYNTIGNGFIAPNVNFNINNQTRLAINGNTGNVGIGTTNLNSRLTIKGGGNVSQSFLGIQDSDGAVMMRVDSDSSGNAFLTVRSTVGIQTALINSSGNSYFNGGNVGIGTTSPSQKLDVSGNINLSGDNRNIFFGGNNTFIGERSNSSELELRGGGNSTAQTVYIDNTGQIGVGTSNPTYTLDINKSGAKARIYDTTGDAKLNLSSGNTAVGIIEFGDTDDINVGKIEYRHNNDSMRFIVNASEAMRINSAGNVGIGTTNPSQKLEVEGNIYTGGSIRIKDAGDQLEFGNANVALQRTSNLLELGGYDGIVFKSSNTVLDSQSERMRITSDGNVGIGTTSPAAGLQVAKGGTTIPAAGASTASAVFGNSTSDDNYGVAIGTNTSGVGYISSQRTDGIATTYDLVIQPNGSNVGIGTTSPSYKLEVDGTFLASGNSTIQGRTSLQKDLTIRGNDALANQGVARFYVDSSNNLYIDTANDGANLFTIKGTNGNVGIGTTSPSVKLHVDGGDVETIAHFKSSDNRGRISIADDDTTSYIISEGSKMSLGTVAYINTSNLTIDSSGKVGIGTTSPNYALDVVGSLNNIAKLTSSTTKSQLLFVDSDSTDTVAIGSEGDDFNVRVDNGDINLKTGSGATATTRVKINSSGNVGIGTTSPVSKLEVDGGDIEVGDSASGLILRSPEGTRYRVTVANGGTLTVTAV